MWARVGRAISGAPPEQTPWTTMFATEKWQHLTHHEGEWGPVSGQSSGLEWARVGTLSRPPFTDGGGTNFGSRPLGNIS